MYPTAPRSVAGNGTIIFEIGQKCRYIKVGVALNLDPLKCRNSGINVVKWIAISKFMEFAHFRCHRICDSTVFKCRIYISK